MSNGNAFSPGRLSAADLVTFNAQLGALVKSGLPLAEGLRTFVAELRRGHLAGVVQAVAEDLEKGRSLADALESRGGALPAFYVSMVKAGAAGGRLGVVLKYAARFLAERRKLHAAVTDSLMYPVFIVLLCIAVFTTAAWLVLPNITTMLANFELPEWVEPGADDTTFRIPNLLWVWVPLLAIAVFVFILLPLAALGKRSWCARFTEGITLHVPFLGRFYRASLLAQFASTFGTLLEAGVPTGEIGRIVESVSPSPRFRTAGRKFTSALESGGSISDAIATDPFFPPTFLFAGRNAESYGGAGKAFLDAGALYADMAEHYARLFLGAFLRPVLGALMLVAVGLTIYGIYRPVIGALLTLVSSLDASAM